MQGRCIGLDVHRDFCEVAIWDAGEVARAPRVAVEARAAAGVRASSCVRSDRVAMEATGNALAIARIIGPHVAAVEIVNTRRLKAIAESKQKTDRHDAKTLAQLLAAGMFAGSWQPDEPTQDAAAPGRAASAAGRAPDTLEERDPGGAASQPQAAAADDRPVRCRRPAWLAGQELPVDERDTIDAALRQIDFLNEEIASDRDRARALRDRLAGGQAADDRPRRRAGHRDRVPRAGRRDHPLPEPAPARRLPRPRPERAPVRQRRPRTPAGSRRRAPRSSGTSSSKPPRPRSAAPAHYARSSSASAPAAATPSRSSPSPASWPCCSGTCSQRPGLRLLDADRHREEAPHGRAHSRHTPAAAAATSDAPTARNDASSSAAQPNTPKPPTSATSPTGTANRRTPKKPRVAA